jgi:hypothetical protein
MTYLRLALLSEAIAGDCKLQSGAVRLLIEVLPDPKCTRDNIVVTKLALSRCLAPDPDLLINYYCTTGGKLKFCARSS